MYIFLSMFWNFENRRTQKLFVKDKKIVESSYSSGILEKPKTIVFVASHAWKHCLLIWRSTSCRQRKSKQPKWQPIWLPSNSKVNFMRIVVKKKQKKRKKQFLGSKSHRGIFDMNFSKGRKIPLKCLGLKWDTLYLYNYT